MIDDKIFALQRELNTLRSSYYACEKKEKDMEREKELEFSNYITKSKSYYLIWEFEKTIEELKKAKEIKNTDEINDLIWLSYYWLWIKNIDDFKNYDRAIEYFNYVINLSKDKEYIYSSYFNIWVAYFRKLDNNKALIYYKKAKNYALHSWNDIIKSSEQVEVINERIKTVEAIISSKKKEERKKLEEAKKQSEIFFKTLEENKLRNKYKKEFLETLWSKLDNLSIINLNKILKKINELLSKKIHNDLKLRLEAFKEIIEEKIN